MFQVVYALFGFGKPGIQNRIQNDRGFKYTQFGFRKPWIQNRTQNDAGFNYTQFGFRKPGIKKLDSEWSSSQDVSSIFSLDSENQGFKKSDSEWSMFQVYYLVWIQKTKGSKIKFKMIQVSL